MTAHREHIRIRYFAAAHAAATVDDEVVGCCAGDTLEHVLDRVADYRPRRAAVLPPCSHLLNSMAASGSRTIADAQSLDVLPLFAGG
jgi:molybdopterin synthase sulfur carrier subunit